MSRYRVRLLGKAISFMNKHSQKEVEQILRVKRNLVLFIPGPV